LAPPRGIRLGQRHDDFIDGISPWRVQKTFGHSGNRDATGPFVPGAGIVIEEGHEAPSALPAPAKVPGQAQGCRAGADDRDPADGWPRPGGLGAKAPARTKAARNDAPEGTRDNP